MELKTYFKHWVNSQMTELSKFSSMQLMLGNYNRDQIKDREWHLVSQPRMRLTQSHPWAINGKKQMPHCGCRISISQDQSILSSTITKRYTNISKGLLKKRKMRRTARSKKSSKPPCCCQWETSPCCLSITTLELFRKKNLKSRAKSIYFNP
jgi:hypothetical protein